MRKVFIGAAMVAAFGVAALCAATAQAPSPSESDQAMPQPAKPPKHKRVPPVSQTNPDLDPEDQLAPSQMKQKTPGAVAQPSGASAAPARPAAHAATAGPNVAAATHGVAPGGRVVACSGVFAKDSSHLKLAMTYDARNATLTDVQANDGTKVQASVLFAKDPARRLEVWWSNPAARSDTYLIVINGKSTWMAPGGMRLGLNLAQLEKLNHKPFRIKGFGKDGIATVSDWDGGALATLPGGCKSGLSLHADPKASPDAIGDIPADKEFSSSDPAVRAVKPTVSEILIGY